MTPTNLVMSSRDKLVTAPFSAGYELVRNVEILTHSEPDTVIDEDLFAALAERFGTPVVGFVGGLHYYLKPTRCIPANTVAVPDASHDEPDAFLIRQ
jgi:hypothetical protein